MSTGHDQFVYWIRISLTSMEALTFANSGQWRQECCNVCHAFQNACPAALNEIHACAFARRCVSVCRCSWHLRSASLLLRCRSITSSRRSLSARARCSTWRRCRVCASSTARARDLSVASHIFCISSLHRPLGSACVLLSHKMALPTTGLMSFLRASRRTLSIFASVSSKRCPHIRTWAYKTKSQIRGFT